MRAHSLQHVPFEGLGNMEPWLKEREFQITSTRFFESADLPSPEEIDLLIVLGGPMSVNDETTYPWFVEEKAFIRHCNSSPIRKIFESPPDSPLKLQSPIELSAAGN